MMRDTLTRIRALAHWEVADDLQALRTRLAAIGAAAATALEAEAGEELRRAMEPVRCPRCGGETVEL